MANKYLEKIAEERDHWEGAKKGLGRGAKIGAGVGGAAGAALGASTGSGKAALGLGALGAIQGAVTGGTWGAGIGAVIGSKKKKAGDHEKKAAERKTTKVFPMSGKSEKPKSITIEGKPGLPAPKTFKAKGRWRTAAAVGGGVAAGALAAKAVLNAKKKKAMEKKAAVNKAKDAPGRNWKATGRKEVPGMKWTKDEGTRATSKASLPARKAPSAGKKAVSAIAKNKGKVGTVVTLGGLAAAAASKLRKNKEA